MTKNQNKTQTKQTATPPTQKKKKKEKNPSRLKTKALNNCDKEKILTKVNVVPEIFVPAVSFESQMYTNVSKCKR